MHLHAACCIIICFLQVPWSREGLLQLLDITTYWTDAQGGPILVHCMDGASQSGLFVAVYTVCEKMKLEQEVDVFHTVKHLKTRRKHCVNSLVCTIYYLVRCILLYITGCSMWGTEQGYQIHVVVYACKLSLFIMELRLNVCIYLPTS